MTTSKIIFYVISAAILIFSLLTVTSKHILRAATFLFIVLVSTAALYFLLNYQFLGAVQITLYAGGIVIMIIFSILLTSHIGQKFDAVNKLKYFASALVVLIGLFITLWVIINHNFTGDTTNAITPNMNAIGKSLLSYGKNGYVLPFEVISILLLAAMIGALVITKKHPENEEIDSENLKDK